MNMRLIGCCLWIVFCLVQQAIIAQCPVKTSSKPFFELQVENGSPVLTGSEDSPKLVFPNDTDVLLRVDVNPFAFKCSVTTTTQQYQENAIPTFLGMLGGVANVQVNTPAPGTPAPGNKSERPLPTDCYTNSQQSTRVAALEALATGISTALSVSQQNQQNTLQTYNKDVQALRVTTTCPSTVAAAQQLTALAPFTIASVQLGGGVQLPLDQAIDSLFQQAQALLPDLTSGLDDACKTSAKLLIDQDSAFLSAISHGTTAVPAAADQWRTQLREGLRRGLIC
jgi:hypothetical protein